MTLVQIKNRFTDEIIHQIETDEKDVSLHIKLCVEDGIIKSVNFSYANFSRADFSRADFSYADFSRAKFSNANFSNAYFSNAYFSNADFSYADFSNAKFSNAKFSNATYKHILIEKALFFDNLYKYQCAAIISCDNESYINLGCHLKKEKEWEDEGFWNNDVEFPNNGNIETRKRQIALMTCKEHLKIMRAEIGL